MSCPYTSFLRDIRVLGLSIGNSIPERYLIYLAVETASHSEQPSPLFWGGAYKGGVVRKSRRAHNP